MNELTPFYTQIDHTADLRIRVHGRSPGDLFGNAARALMDLMIEDASGDTTAVDEVALEGDDFADLMVRWLGEILYLFEVEGMVATVFDIHELEPKRLRATVRGVPFDPEIHEILTDIKAVTYHEIGVGPKGGRWEAEVTFDV
jgi:SHS2 domain-containing protein